MGWAWHGAVRRVEGGTMGMVTGLSLAVGGDGESAYDAPPDLPGRGGRAGVAGGGEAPAPGSDAPREGMRIEAVAMEPERDARVRKGGRFRLG